MEATTTPISTPMPTSAVATPMPTPTPTPTPTPQPMVVNNDAPMMADGGSTSEGGTKGFLKSLNWIEVGFGILGVAALTYVIYYYRFKVQQDKLINNELQRQIDEIKMNLQTTMKGKYKTI